MLKNHLGDGPPSCFGNWEKTDPKCVGGPDSTYRSSLGTHLRPACNYESSCSARTQASRFVPVASLTRNVPGGAAHVASAPWQPGRTWPAPQSPPSPPFAGPPMQLGYHMPQYLSVREPIDEPILKRLLVELFRSLMKSSGHTLSNFFDSEAFTARPKDPRGEP
jgi:hypothetical protein